MTGADAILEMLAEGYSPHEIATASGLATTEIVYFRATRTVPLATTLWGIEKWEAIREKLPKKEKPEEKSEGETEKRKAGRPPKSE